jgi:general secretion pathway protein E/type IV pilus assembly protein PilB
MGKQRTPSQIIQPPPTQRLGDRLQALGHLSNDEIDITLHEQRLSGDRFGAVLLRLGFIREEILADTLADMGGFEAVKLDAASIDPAVAARLPRAVAERCKVLPIAIRNDRLRLAIADPHDIAAIDEVRRYFQRSLDIEPVVATAADIADVLAAGAVGSDEFDDILNAMRDGDGNSQRNDSGAWKHPVVKLVDKIIGDAVRKGASDIHLEPESTFVRLRIRVDGVLRQVRALHREHWPEIANRLKLMAGMNIADTRGMQDGRFRMQVGGADIDFRMASMPTVQGENIVIRILDHRRAVLPLDQLGYSEDNLKRLETILQRPEGIVLVCGPTGCGKTTTLYAVLRKLSSVDTNIMTLEEPVEYQFELVRQTSIQDQQNMGFAEGVRGLLRQAPDIIFVGEIRDDDTARMAVRAAMTGHQVFSTLHSNDALGALPRLADLGLGARLLAENIAGVVAQRLVRRLCPQCKKTRMATSDERALCDQVTYQPADASVLRRAGFAEAPQAALQAPLRIAEAVGCDACDHTGYRGRLAVTEVLRVTPEMDELIAAEAPRSALREQAARDGFKTMAQDGMNKVMKLETSLDELRRNVDLTRVR